MKREEILSRSRKEQIDEYEVKTFKDAQTTGIIVVVGICIFFFLANAIISDIKHLESGIASFDYVAILFAYLSGINFYSYVKLKNKQNLVYGIGFSFAFICMLILYFITI